MTINRLLDLLLCIPGLVLTDSTRAGSACTSLTLQSFVQIPTCLKRIVVPSTTIGAIQELSNVLVMACCSTELGSCSREWDVSIHFPARARLIVVQIWNVLILYLCFMGRLTIVLWLLYEILMHVEPLVFENVGLIVAIIFVITPTVAVITHIALFYLIFDLKFRTLSVKWFKKSVTSKAILCSQLNFGFTWALSGNVVDLWHRVDNMCIFKIHALNRPFICILRQIIKLNIQNFNALLRSGNIFDLVQTCRLRLFLASFVLFLDYINNRVGRTVIVVVVLIIIGLKPSLMIVADSFQIICGIVVVFMFDEIRPQNLGLWTLVNRARMFRNPSLRLDFTLNGCLPDISNGCFFFLFFVSCANRLLWWVLVQHL